MSRVVPAIRSYEALRVVDHPEEVIFSFCFLSGREEGALTRGAELARKVRTGIAALCALALALGANGLIAAPDDERTISLYHIHTKETLSIVYKRNGAYVPDAMEKIDWLMRDWRRNEKIKMDPEAIDILWEIHTELGSKEPIHIVCGYRSSGTNDMLRRTVGGQAKNSQHISGKAIDAYFPDVPPKFVRYAALVRERGGVGYYPTSALPFVHVDTGRVRHWPRIAREELALLFPNGRSKHIPIGGPLGPGDYQKAKDSRKELAIEVASYLELKVRPKTQYAIVAAVGPPAPPAPKLAVRPPAPQKLPPAVLAKLSMPVSKPPPTAETKIAAVEPKLVAQPKLVERPSRFAPRPSEADRTKLDRLVSLASLEPGQEPKLITPPTPAARPVKPAIAPPAPEAGVSETGTAPNSELALIEGWGAETRWVTAPAYDDDHPEELSYQPFPILPLMTDTSSPDDPVLAQLVHPDLAKTLEVIDDVGEIQPMRLRPRQQVAELMLAQQFRGAAVTLNDAIPAPADASQTGLAKRAVKTVAR
jgi:uncharacterized protein YcbK (DUF882 family)